MPGEAQYTIYIPARGSDGEELPWLLSSVRRSLSKAGIDGRTIVRNAEGDWGKAEEPVNLVIVIAPDEPRTDATIHAIALGAKELSKKEGVFVTKQPISTWLVDGPGKPPEPEPTDFSPVPER